MDYGLIISHLYPQAISIEDYNVAQRGHGTIELTYWNEALGPRPTEAELQNAWVPALKGQKTAEVRRRVVSECEAVMPVWEFIYITRARIADPRTATLEAVVKKGRDMETYINNPARTEGELQATNWDTF